MSYKAKKKVKGFLKFLFTGTALIVITIIGNIIYDNNYRERDPTDSITTELTSEVNEINYESILLATKNKIEAANVFILVNYSTGYEIGSGTIINEDESYYYALTNYHVIDGNNEVIDSYSVTTSDGVATSFEILVADDEKDLSYIRFIKENRGNITPLNLSTEELEPYSMCISVGNPYGEIGTTNYGNIIRLTSLQELELTHEVIEHTSVLAAGSSGGALTDIFGNLIGINTWELQSKYYAIPLSVIYTFLEENNL